MSIFCFKWMNIHGECHGGGRAYLYDLPTIDYAGKWHVKKEQISLCGTGFHATSFDKIHRYSNYGVRLFLVELD